ncbi:hypothetical protein Taro_012643 [Colocasia esculenta]|uniref:Uncharacterized protein n=1 Tax=Colocasia esculenta TaxID=4460 RepID=A0A843U9P1_COLES|nr:hypothetical protein [Colocasia esculenta]
MGESFPQGMLVTGETGILLGWQKEAASGTAGGSRRGAMADPFAGGSLVCDGGRKQVRGVMAEILREASSHQLQLFQKDAYGRGKWGRLGVS